MRILFNFVAVMDAFIFNHYLPPEQRPFLDSFVLSRLVNSRCEFTYDDRFIYLACDGIHRRIPMSAKFFAFEVDCFLGKFL